MKHDSDRLEVIPEFLSKSGKQWKKNYVDGDRTLFMRELESGLFLEKG